MRADNGAFYALNGVPFVMGTTGGDREKLLRDVTESGVYAVIAPQMGKQVWPSIPTPAPDLSTIAIRALL